MGKRGYALLGVLWLAAGVTGLGIVLSAVARDAVSAARNRIALTQAEWVAEACLARARGAVQESLAEAAGDPRTPISAAWNRVGETVAAARSLPLDGCRLSAQAIGSRADVNRAEEPVLAHLLRASGLPTAAADSVAGRIVARREIRPFRHPGELDLLVDASKSASLGELLDVEPAPLSVNHLPAPILETLPGFTGETVERALRGRPGGMPFTTFLEVAEGVSPSARATLAAAIPQLANLVTFVPRPWLLRADARAGAPPIAVRIELHLQRDGVTTFVVRRRAWTP